MKVELNEVLALITGEMTQCDDTKIHFWSYPVDLKTRKRPISITYAEHFKT